MPAPYKISVMPSLKLPSGAYYYKYKNGYDIYKNKYLDEYYMVRQRAFGFEVKYYKGECHC